MDNQTHKALNQNSKYFQIKRLNTNGTSGTQITNYFQTNSFTN